VHDAIVLGTAGHIDHGKTSLVRALTGIDTDRLPVEKARGITTELGFAWMTLGARRVAVVDVPGHERFVRSMVAGATGLDLVCLVIAADEGVMPQTREHLDICDLLGIRRGVIVLTKRDLVDADWLAMVTEDVRAAVAGSFLASAPIVAVSTRPGAEEGLDELRATLARIIDATGGVAARPTGKAGVAATPHDLAPLVDELPPRASVLRLPIDRVFTVKGIGTVVTGTIIGGELAVGDALTVMPSGLATHARGIEVHGAAVSRAGAGQRAAVNLGGLAVDDLARGDLLAHPGQVAASHILDVELRHLATAPGALRSRAKLLVHHGTTQVLATLSLVGADELAPGATALAQLRIAATTPLAALPGDRFIIRGFVATRTHGSTIGGGRVIRVLAPKARDGARHARTVAELAGARLDQQLALVVRAAAAAGLERDELVRRTGAPADALAEALAMLIGSGELLAIPLGDERVHYLHAQAIADIEAKIAGKLAALPAGADGLPREELRTQLPAALSARAYDAILAGLVRRGAITTEADRVRKPSAAPRATPSPIEARLAAELRRWGIEPPRPKDLPAALGIPEPEVKAALASLVAARLAVRIKPDLYMHAEVVAEVRDKLVAFLAAHPTIDAQQWKDLTGASRKFTIPLAEFFDAEKLTLRVGDVRRRR
jgi:selenocysteine-specific elongation factor